MIEQLQNTFYSEIPLTRAMGIEVLKYDDMMLSLRAPLSVNRNDKGTAFGGSLYSTAVLAGWGLIYLMLKERGITADIMIHESHTQFLAPVRSDIVATCRFDSEAQITKALTLLERRGLARIQLTTHIATAETEALMFEGSYAISR